MQSVYCLMIIVTIGFISCSPSPKNTLAPTPPMGWNSWDCFGTDVTEAEVKANADYMAEHLKPFGWEYVVIDLGWYLPPEITTITFKQEDPPQSIDEWGRLVPNGAKFPSATESKSFKALADYLHSKGLKFGIHVMRGIPSQAVEENLPVKGTSYHAQDIAALTDTCVWYDGLVGVNMDHPGAQAYYNALLELYAEWGVDYIKADDMSHPYHAREIKAMHNAIVNCGRPIVLSLSPGAAPIEKIDHLRANANLWRISPDFWDDWQFLYRQFELSQKWQGLARPGAWPDADMLPLGKLRKTTPDDYVCDKLGLSVDEITDEYSRFSDVEKKTLMTFWCILRSPLMFGGHLPETDDYTLSLITNTRALAVNQHSENNRQVYRHDSAVVWAADDPGTKDTYVALFNIGDEDTVNVSVGWDAIGVHGTATVTDLWSGETLGEFPSLFSADLPPHGSGLYRIAR